uniref:Uncharacterized protein n=1 Tax=Bionectria ochroleuca TaxID=29856 RepID=A0A8H7TJN8_BIOOC
MMLITPGHFLGVRATWSNYFCLAVDILLFPILSHYNHPASILKFTTPRFRPTVAAASTPRTKQIADSTYNAQIDGSNQVVKMGCFHSKTRNRPEDSALAPRLSEPNYQQTAASNEASGQTHTAGARISPCGRTWLLLLHLRTSGSQWRRRQRIGRPPQNDPYRQQVMLVELLCYLRYTARRYLMISPAHDRNKKAPDF